MNNSQKNLLRGLAEQVAEIAALPIQKERIRLWKAMNRLQPERPLVAVYPERAWNELVPPASLFCTDPLHRKWEYELRCTIYQHKYIPDDRPLHDQILIPYTIHCGDEGVTLEKIHSGSSGPEAVAFNPPIVNLEDCERLRVPEVTVDHEDTMRKYEQACEVFDDILNVRIWGGQPWWSVGFGKLCKYRGLQQAMLDMYENPDVLHRILSHIQAKQEHFMDVLEKEQVLSLNNDVVPVTSFMGSGHEAWTDELPAEDYAGTARWKDMWGLGEMQEFSNVGPDQFWEFSLQYQLPLLKRFGLVNYGCCEPLDSYYDMLMKHIPKLRRLSVTSPYASKEVAAEKLKNNYIFSWKPNPAPLAAKTVNWQDIRTGIRETLEIGEDSCLEMVMKSTETFANDPDRITTWVKTAFEEIQNE